MPLVISKRHRGVGATLLHRLVDRTVDLAELAINVCQGVLFGNTAIDVGNANGDRRLAGNRGGDVRLRQEPVCADGIEPHQRGDRRDQEVPQGFGRGVSLQFAFATYMAHIAEVEVSRDGAVPVHRVVCAVDCGIPVNPDTIQAQIQSAIMFRITAALYGEITLKDGRVEQSNFHDYQILRMNQAPAVEVHIVQSRESPGGMGEAGTSVIVPAVANAIFAATGKRLRKMPIDIAVLKRPV
jgi:CO/xanthine dehydrogenase Mo-binding subunit